MNDDYTIVNQFGSKIRHVIIVNDLAMSLNVHGKKEENVFGNLKSRKKIRTYHHYVLMYYSAISYVTLRAMRSSMWLIFFQRRSTVSICCLEKDYYIPSMEFQRITYNQS